MDSIIIYMAKASIALALFYGLYVICFRNDTFFRLRRFYFLFAIIFSLVFPVINIEIPSEQEAAVQIPVYWLSAMEINDVVVEPAESRTIDIWSIVFVCLSVVSAFYALRFIIQLAYILKLRIKNDFETVASYKVINIKEKNISPFSFFKWIFINKEISEAKDINEIIVHEQVHVRQHHFIDVILSEIVCTVFWWNPFVWFLKNEIKTNLEYLADEGVLQAGFGSKDYQYSLLQISNKNTGIPIINHFNVSQLKKRITMMNKRKTPISKAVKYLLIAPLGIALLLGNAIQASPDAASKVLSSYLLDEEPLTKAEQMPTFPGGAGAEQKFLAKNIMYPVEAQEKKLQGRVIARFTIKSTGDIADIKILKGVDPLLDNEAIRVIKTMPKWNPGKQDGKTVDVYYTLPIIFALRGIDGPKITPSDMDNEIVAIGYGSKEDKKNESYVAFSKMTNIKFTAEEMPSYPGGMQAMIEFIQTNLEYPEEAAKQGIGGRVTVRFVITKTGEIVDAVILRGVEPTMNAEALRVVQAMPKWIPGKENGEAVDMYFTLPVHFKAESPTEKEAQ